MKKTQSELESRVVQGACLEQAVDTAVDFFGRVLAIEQALPALRDGQLASGQQAESIRIGVSHRT